MKRAIFLTATAAVLIMVASCGQNAQKQAMNDQQFAALMKEIFYKLPESVMPTDLKTEEQRKNVVYDAKEGEDGISVSDNPKYANLLSYGSYWEGSHENWYLAGYLTDDQQNVVLMIQYIGGYDEASEIMFDKTLNYNIKTKEFTEIPCPLVPFTTQELFREFNIEDDEIREYAMGYFNENREIYYNFDRDGFSASVNLTMFWYGEGPEGTWKYYQENDIYPEHRQPACRKWDGSRFVKTGASNTDAQDNEQSDEQSTQTLIKVSNAKEFLEALGSNKIIEMAPGKYNLSEWDPIFNNQPEEVPPYPNLSNEGSPKLARNVSWSDNPFDGGELVLSKIKNLTIRGLKTPGSAEIIVDPRYAFVLSFDDCSGIAIEGLSVGHSVGGECMGGVFFFTNSSQITISNTAMYGCGTVGLWLDNASDMKVTDSRIYKCTDGIMVANEGKNITFENCTFDDNPGSYYSSLVSVNETKNMSFSNCQFNNNHGDNMFAVENATVSVQKSTFKNNDVQKDISMSSGVKFTDCVFK
jgi:hypothetical protein